jgi:AAA domain/AAA domain, putative AbiEii toxin, Type IV TA system
MIHRLELKNFKRFRDEIFEFTPNGLTLIAGGNNSGKSSIPHALALWEYCRRQIETKHGRAALELGAPQHVFRVPYKHFTPLMVPDFQHLWTNLTTAVGGTPAPMTLKLTWLDDAAGDASRELEFTLDLPGPLRVRTTVSTVPAGTDIPRIAYLPPFAGIQVKERKMEVGDRERLLGQGLSGAVLRNHLCDLERLSRTAYEALRNLRGNVGKADRANFLRSDAWKQLVAVLNEEFKCMVYPAESLPRGEDGHIDLTANLTKGTFVNRKFAKFPKYHPRDVIVEGSGFLQWLSVFALAVDREIDVLLLDEADVHLHPTLQAKLLFRLNREAVDKRKQMLYVTHSTEVIRQAEYRRIYHVGEKGKGYLSEESGKVGVIAGLGSLYVPRIEKLHKSRRLLIVEGTADLELLKIWAATLDILWPANLVVWFSTGKPSERKTLYQELNKEVMKEEYVASAKIVRGIHALSLRDRDDEPPNTTNVNLSDGVNPDVAIQPGEDFRILHRKWRRRHIENYLILPAAVARACAVKRTAWTEQNVVDFLRDQHSAIINQTFVSSDCHQTIADLRAKEITYGKPRSTDDRFGVSRFDIARAMTAAEICDDVKTFLQQVIVLCQ